MGYWIVVVDDDAIELKNAKIQLSGDDLRVSLLHSGKDLLKFMENNAPDLILLDILMPEMDGFETFHLLRKLEAERNRSETPVIFLSGNEDSEVEKKSLQDGASDFVRKPIDREILLSRVNKTIENHRMIESLTKKATIDKLTGFLNKAIGTERISAICSGGTGALMLIDMDSFKLINDIYGHDMGDKVLISFADIVGRNTREEDVISRIGGDEFLAFFSGLTSKLAVKALTDRLNEQLVNRCIELMGEGFDIPIGISVGVAFVPDYSRDFSVLFRDVDVAMYRVKQNGKHGVLICEDVLPKVTSGDKKELDGDMQRITQILEERNTPEGAMVLGMDAFIQTYRYALRVLRGYKRGAEKILFSLHPEDEAQTDLSELSVAFIEVLKKLLRNSDVIVQVKSDQILAFLPVISREEGSEVARRVEKMFLENESSRVKLRYVAEHIDLG
ncbi:MAG: diguanylate cyclase [Butyrivibrio sp.]|nr:diguanylate cyclase [Butyrivibrio sp.]